jgi:outer membrane biosynthesis protein TonB
MPTVDPARLAAALDRLGLTELQAQSRGLNLHPAYAPLEVRGLLDGSEPLDAPELTYAEEAEVEAPESEMEEPAEESEEEPTEEPDEDADEASSEAEPEAPAEEPEAEETPAEEEAEEEEDADEASEPEAEAEVANPADGVTIDAFEALAKTLTDEQLTAALGDTRKGIQVIAQTELEDRA